MTTAYPLHAAAISIMLSDHREQMVTATTDGDDTEHIIFLAIVTRLLSTVAECPADRLDDLLSRWMTDEDEHEVVYDAKICVTEMIQDLLYAAEAAAPQLERA